MTFGQIAEGNNANKLIYRCFDYLPEVEQRKFLKKFRDQPHNEPQIMHTLAELVCGAYLSSLGFQFVHELELNNKAPDWCIMGDKMSPEAFIDVITIHIDKETDDDIERQLHAKRLASYWMNGRNNNTDRLYSAIQKKATECRELANALLLPFVIAVHSDFRVKFDPEEILSCLLPDEYGIFTLYPHVSGLLFFEDHGTQYAFRFFENSKSVRKFNLKDGLYP
jgi:hypothetical protein